MLVLFYIVFLNTWQCRFSKKCNKFLPFKRQLQKMVKHIQTIRGLLQTNCLSVFDHFVGLTLEGLTGFHD